LQCGKACPEDFVTCSHACNIAYTNSPQRSASDESGWDLPPEGKTLVDVGAVAHALGITKAAIHAWVFNRKMPRECYYRLGPRMTRYDLEALRKWRGISAEAPKSEMTEEPEKLPRIEVIVQDVSTEVEAFRKRGLAAAKQAFRDVMLEGADQAKARGNHELRARFLEDFIFFEEGLKMHYEGRGQ
jgi:predicted DNA-binding transcriptional regulator AlpA